MELETLKETLLEALNIQAKAVSGRSNIPVLSNVLLRTEGSKLFLYTTNLEMNIVTWIGAEVATPGSTTVSLKRFMEYVATLPEGNLQLRFEGNELHVTSRNSNAVFNTIPAEEFPKISDIKEEVLCSIDSSMFFEAVNNVAFCASKDDTRPTFTGVFIEVAQSVVTFTAIDGFRLASRKMHIETGVTNPISFIVPANYIEDIARMSAEKDEDVKLYIIGNKNQLGIRYKNSDFIIRLIEGIYPDYSRVIPLDFTTDVIIDRQAFLDAVRTATIFSSQREIGKTQLLVANDHITMRTFQKEIGENETTIDAHVKGETGPITFNSRYLLDAVNHLNTDTIMIRIILKGEKPSVFYDTKRDAKEQFAFQDTYLTLMTPIKVENE